MTQITTYKKDITTKNHGRGVYALWSVNDVAATFQQLPGNRAARVSREFSAKRQNQLYLQ
jgi:predicted RNA-binding protein YlxR (DUF448 family)